MNRKCIVLKIKLFLVLLLVANLSAQSDEVENTKAVINKKADFIIDIASKIDYDEASKNKTYRIGVYGKNREIKDLYAELEKRTKSISIKGKSVELLNFRRVRKVEPVDLLYITGNSRIRLSDLNKKLEGRPYIILTENFPFGVSMLNFAMNKDNDLFFEIHDQVLKNKGANIDKSILKSDRRITSEKDWKKKLEAAMLIIKEKQQKIEKTTKEIKQQTKKINKQIKVISYLSTAIFIAVISMIIISLLVFVLLRINKQRKNALNEITDSINYAKRIQTAILSKKTLFEDHFNEHFVLYQPKDIVSGDFYLITMEDDKLFFTVADCTGHGVPGAMLSLICHNSLKKTIKELKIYEPAKILDKVAEILKNLLAKGAKDVNDGMDLALCCLHLKTNKFEYAGANNPLYYIKNKKIEVIKPDRQPIGKYEDRKPYKNHVLEYKKGDVFYLFSDGYADQFGGSKNKKLSYKKFREILLKNHKESMDEQKNILQKYFYEWKGEQEQIDDVCVMGVRI